MSSTRYSNGERPLAHERYLSDPLYVDRRALGARAVAEKAALLKDPVLSRLILFLQGVSIELSGLEAVSDWILERLPQWIGSPTMRRLGLKAGQSYRPADADVISSELGLPAGQGDASLFTARCAKETHAALPRFLIELCINPSVSLAGGVSLERQQSAKWGRLQERLSEEAESARCIARGESPANSAKGEPLYSLKPTPAWSQFPWLDLLSALLAYEHQHSELSRAGFVETSFSREVWKAIDLARTIHTSAGPVPRHIVIVQGVEGVGKTSAAKAKCKGHAAEMRFVTLPGIVSRTTFFRSVSRACGLAHGESLKAEQMQANIENFLRLTRMILVIDEAHRIAPTGPRVYAEPELMNWVYALSELRSPIVLLVTPRFASRMDTIEECTDWRSGQFKRRVRQYILLKEKPQIEDLEAITRSRFPRASANILDEVVGFAGSARYSFDAIHNVADDALRLAQEAGREQPNFDDVTRAIEECADTYRALTTPRDIAALNQRKSTTRRVKTSLPTNGSRAAARVPLACGDSEEDLHQAETPMLNRIGEYTSEKV